MLAILACSRHPTGNAGRNLFPMPTRRRILSIAVLVALGVGAAGWLARDLPRQRVERALSQRLGRPVTVEHLDLAAFDRFRLRGLEAEGIAGLPWLGSFRFERLEVEGTVPELLAGRLRKLRIEGGTVRMRQPPWPEEPPLPPTELSIGLLELSDLELLMPATGKTAGTDETAMPARLRLGGRVEGFTGSLDENMGFDFEGTSPRLELGPLTAFALAAMSSAKSGAQDARSTSPPGGFLADLRLRLRWPMAGSLETSTPPAEPRTAAQPGGPRVELEIETGSGELPAEAGRMRIDASRLRATGDPTSRSGELLWSASRLRLEPDGGAALELPQPSLEASFDAGAPSSAQPLRLAISATLPPVLPQARGSAAWRPDQGLDGLETLELTTSDIEIGALLPWLGPWLGAPPELAAEGRLRLEATTVDSTVEAEAILDLDRLASSAGSVPFEARRTRATFEARWSPAAGDTTSRIAAAKTAAAPVTDGGLSVEARADFGELRLAVPAGSEVRLDAPSFAASARIDPRRWPPAAPGSAESRGVGAFLALLEEPLSATLELPRGGVVGPGADLPRELLVRSLPSRAVASLAAAPVPADGGIAVDLRLNTAALGAGRAHGAVDAPETASGDTGPRFDLAWSWGLPELTRLIDLAAAAGVELPEDLRVAGSLSARGRLRGTAARPALVADLTVDGAAAELGESSLTQVQAKTRVRWPVAGAPRREPGIAIEGLRLDALARGSGLEAVALTAEAEGWWGGERLAVRHLDVDAGALGRLVASGELAGTAADVDVGLTGVGIAAWRETLRPITGELGSGLVLDGALAAQLHLARGAGGAWSTAGTVEAQGTGFTSIDGSQVLQGLGSRWQLRAEGAPDTPVSFHAKGDVDGFQLLWNTFYGDFGPVETRVEAHGTFEPAEAGDRAARFALQGAWSLPEGRLAAVELQTEADGSVRYAAELEVADLAATFERHLRQPLVEAAPGLAELELSGALAFEAAGRFGEQGATLVGRLSLAGIGADNPPSQVAIRDLHLELPLALEIDADGALQAGQVDERGRLGYSSIAFRGLELPAVDTELAVRGERIELEEPLDVPILGGHVVLEQLALRRLLQPDRSYECALRIEGIELARLAEALGTFPLEGTVEAYLPQVRLAGDRLEIAGGGRADLFGGFVEVGDLAAEKLFDPFPRFRFSARFENIDLEQVTGKLDFGEMTGLVEGSLSEVEVVGTSPVRFEALIRSPEKRKMRRVISVRAINNIAILGTGAGTNILDRGIHKFFDRYTYGALGISMSLRGDAFRLRGLEHRGGRELFLRGRLPFPIDVVNVQPGGAVSFQTMVRRLRSLDLSKVTTGPAPDKG